MAKLYTHITLFCAFCDSGTQELSSLIVCISDDGKLYVAGVCKECGKMTCYSPERILELIAEKSEPKEVSLEDTPTTGIH